jgi:hypothetical protein
MEIESQATNSKEEDAPETWAELCSAAAVLSISKRRKRMRSPAGVGGSGGLLSCHRDHTTNAKVRLMN